MSKSNDSMDINVTEAKNKKEYLENLTKKIS